MGQSVCWDGSAASVVKRPHPACLETYQWVGGWTSGEQMVGLVWPSSRRKHLSRAVSRLLLKSVLPSALYISATD